MVIMFRYNKVCRNSKHKLRNINFTLSLINPILKVIIDIYCINNPSSNCTCIMGLSSLTPVIGVFLDLRHFMRLGGSVYRSLEYKKYQNKQKLYKKVVCSNRIKIRHSY